MTDLIQFAVALLLHQGARGACEAITMSPDGVREHRWFRWYHRLRILELASFALVVYAASRLTLTGPVVMIVLGAFILSWEIFELLYSWGRWEKWLPTQENIFGGGWYAIGRRRVMWAHVARAGAGSAIIVWGILLLT